MRSRLGELGLAEALIETLMEQVKGPQGLATRVGTLPDATTLGAQVWRPTRSAGLGACNPLDRDASRTVTQLGRQAHFAFTAHVSVDPDAGSVAASRDIITLPATTV